MINTDHGLKRGKISYKNILCVKNDSIGIYIC